MQGRGRTALIPISTHYKKRVEFIELIKLLTEKDITAFGSISRDQ